MVDDPAHYRWCSYRANALGQADTLLTPHDRYLALGGHATDRLAAYRALFRDALGHDAITDIRLALDQGQALGSKFFLDKIEQMTGQRRQARPRGRPRKALADGGRLREK
jgi:putative transposase